MGIQQDWASHVVGKALNPDNFAENQCVDVVDHYGEFIFGVPWQTCVGGVMGAKDLLDTAPDEYWIRIDYTPGFIPKPGDIGVMGGSPFNQWGHTFYTESADERGIDVIQQDGFAPPLRNGYSIKPAHRARLAYYSAGTGPLIGVLRPRPEKMIGSLTPAGTINTPEDDMFTDEDRKTLTFLKEAIKDGGSSMLYGASLMSLIDDVPRRAANAVAGYPVKRDGKIVPWIQDSADGTSLAWSLQRTVLPAMAEKLAIDPATLREAFEEAIAGTSVTVTIGSTEGQAANGS